MSEPNRPVAMKSTAPSLNVSAPDAVGSEKDPPFDKREGKKEAPNRETKRNASEGSAYVKSLATLAREFSDLPRESEQSEANHQLQTDGLIQKIAAAMVAHSGANFVFLYSIDANQHPDIRLLATRHRSLPPNVQQWAVKIANRVMTTGESAVDQSEGESGNCFSMVALPLNPNGLVTRDAAITGSQSQGNPILPGQQQILISMFTKSSADGVRELAVLEKASACLAEVALRQDCNQYRSLAHDTASIAEIESRVSTAVTTAQVCQRLADEIANHIAVLESLEVSESGPEGVDVYVGEVDDRRRVALVARAHSQDLEDHKVAIESAMAECQCRNQTAVWPADPNARHALLCHRKTAEALSATSLITVCIADGNQEHLAVAMVSSTTPLSTRTRRWLEACGPAFGSTISLVRRAQANRLQQFVHGLSQTLGKSKTKTAIRVVALILALGMLPIPLQVVTECEVQPEASRYVCAAFDARLKECLVEPGDLVSAGDVIARLDETEIAFELAEVEADYHRASKEQDGHMVEHKSGEARVAQLEAEKLQSRSQLLKHRNAHLELLSPIDGVVIEGDLDNAIGMPVEKGQSLFRVAPLDNLTIDVFIPESDIRYVSPEMKVRVRLDAFPFEVLMGEVVRIHPASEIQDDGNVFVATVHLDITTDRLDRLRPGMQGSARISSLWRPFWWNVLHQPLGRCMRFVGW